MSVCTVAADAERGRKAPPDICAKRKMPTSKRMLEAAAEKLAASTQQLRAKIPGLGGEPVSTGSVNGAISLDDHAILAECERKQHMAKNA
jgi:hypothetical protein